MLCNNFYVSIRRTNKVNVNDQVHALPPDLGGLPEYRVADWHGCPKEWSKDGRFVPVEEGQPLWFDLRCNPKCACIVSVQRLNPVTGQPADLQNGLQKDPQNYLVLPEQRWLDGYAKDGKVYQFVVTKDGEGLSVAEYVLPVEMRDSHAIGFAFFLPKNPKPPIVQPTTAELSKFYSPLRTLYYRASINTSINNTKEYVNTRQMSRENTSCFDAEIATSGSLHLDDEVQTQDFDQVAMGAGGRITQRIIPDDNTKDYYHEKPAAVFPVYLCLPRQFAAIMKAGRSQDPSRKDKFINSGQIGGIQVPLVS